MPHFYSILQNLTEILGDGRFLCEFFVALLVIFVSRLFQIRSGGKVSSQYAPVEMRDSSPQPIYLAHKEWKGRIRCAEAVCQHKPSESAHPRISEGNTYS